MIHSRSLPPADGLYDPTYEHDACGVAMVARLDNQPDHEAIDRALTALDNLEHRGAEGADVKTGDGAGILAPDPDAFFREVVDFELPAPGTTASASASSRATPTRAASSRSCSSSTSRVEGQRVLGWRDVPVDEDYVGESPTARARTSASSSSRPAPASEDDQDAFERKLYVIRRIVELAAGPDFYAPSSSSRTIVYKGMLISHQLGRFYPDLPDERFASALALVHSRFSTNTFPAGSSPTRTA